MGHCEVCTHFYKHDCLYPDDLKEQVAEAVLAECCYLFIYWGLSHLGMCGFTVCFFY